MGREVVGLLDASSLHSDLLLLAGDGGRYSGTFSLLNVDAVDYTGWVASISTLLQLSASDIL